MRNTYTIKETSKRSPYTFFRVFGIFSTSKSKTLLDAQIKYCNTKISTTPNTNDEPQHNTNASPTAPHLPKVNHNFPLSLLPRIFRILELANFLNSRPNYIQSPIQHIVTQQFQSDDTYEQIIEQPYITNFRSQNNYFLAHDEPTSWITSPLKFPPSQSPKAKCHQTTFCFPAT